VPRSLVGRSVLSPPSRQQSEAAGLPFELRVRPVNRSYGSVGIEADLTGVVLHHRLTHRVTSSEAAVPTTTMDPGEPPMTCGYTTVGLTGFEPATP
jgi:hypothetical protein